MQWGKRIKADLWSQVPEEPEKCDPAAIQLKFCMPDGNRPMRRFLGTHCIKHVTSFVASQESICNPRGRFVIRLANTLPPCTAIGYQ